MACKCPPPCGHQIPKSPEWDERTLIEVIAAMGRTTPLSGIKSWEIQTTDGKIFHVSATLVSDDGEREGADE